MTDMAGEMGDAEIQAIIYDLRNQAVEIAMNDAFTPAKLLVRAIKAIEAAHRKNDPHFIGELLSSPRKYQNMRRALGLVRYGR